ncbi:TetR-like C-terminal domain-containing protein [Actinomadura viridis]|uniref:TetR-like C-terminal domain-containing protein n=1 Tax=Actinomadura viridis TaxID=58110 RepID=UPI0036C91E02
MGVAYVRFATGHRAHFAVMFRPELYRADDPEVLAASARAHEVLRRGARARSPEGADERTAALAAWSIAHGFAELWLSGALSDLGDSPDAAARPVLRMLFSGPPPSA